VGIDHIASITDCICGLGSNTLILPAGASKDVFYFKNPTRDVELTYKKKAEG
jgi:hypothetical protein